MESKQLYLIQRNKHREDAKTRRPRNMSQRKENKTPEKRTKQNGDQQATRCRVQNTGSKELSEPSEDLSSMKKGPVRSEGHTN